MDLTQGLELAAVAFNIAYVILAARKNVWCWPAGIIGSALSIALFLETKLYAESVLFTYYVFMGFYGWMAWKRNESKDQEIEIIEWKLSTHVKVLFSGYALTYILFLILKFYTDAEMPLLDSFTTVFSFIATWMVAKRIFENWIYWIAINSLSAYLYTSRELSLYAMLAIVFAVMSVYGYRSWRVSRQKMIQSL